MRNDAANLTQVSILIPAGLPAWINAEAVQDTLDTFQPFYEQQLTVDDAINMLMAAGNLFDLLKDHHAHEQSQTDKGNQKSGEKQATEKAIRCSGTSEQP